MSKLDEIGKQVTPQPLVKPVESKPVDINKKVDTIFQDRRFYIVQGIKAD